MKEGLLHQIDPRAKAYWDKIRSGLPRATYTPPDDVLIYVPKELVNEVRALIKARGKAMTNTNKKRADFAARTDSDVLGLIGLDAAKWAHEFNVVAKRLRYSDMDEGWLIGWFANAIEQGRIAGREAERANKVYPDFKPEEMTFTKVGDQLHVSEQAETVTTSTAGSHSGAAEAHLRCAEEPYVKRAEAVTDTVEAALEIACAVDGITPQQRDRLHSDIVSLIRQTKPEPSPDTWDEDRLRKLAKERGWYIRENTSVPDIHSGGWRHPFSVTCESRELVELLNKSALAKPEGK